MTRVVAEPLVLVLLMLLCCRACVSLSPVLTFPAASVQTCYFSVGLESVSEVHLIPMFLLFIPLTSIQIPGRM